MPPGLNPAATTKDQALPLLSVHVDGLLGEPFWQLLLIVRRLAPVLSRVRFNVRPFLAEVVAILVMAALAVLHSSRLISSKCRTDCHPFGCTASSSAYERNPIASSQTGSRKSVRAGCARI